MTYHLFDAQKFDLNDPNFKDFLNQTEVIDFFYESNNPDFPQIYKASELEQFVLEYKQLPGDFEDHRELRRYGEFFTSHKGEVVPIKIPSSANNISEKTLNIIQDLEKKLKFNNQQFRERNKYSLYLVLVPKQIIGQKDEVNISA